MNNDTAVNTEGCLDDWNTVLSGGTMNFTNSQASTVPISLVVSEWRASPIGFRTGIQLELSHKSERAATEAWIRIFKVPENGQRP